MASIESHTATGFGNLENICCPGILCLFKHWSRLEPWYDPNLHVQFGLPGYTEVLILVTLVTNNYQSNGSCKQSCQGYAFAVVQGKSCWCSNYVPGDTTSTSSCNVACPGYPFESCGDPNSGLYGYVALGPEPSGTQGASSSSSTAEETSSQPTEVAPQPVSIEPTTGASLGPVSSSDLAVPPDSSTSVPGSLPFPGNPSQMAAIPFSFSTIFLTQSIQNFAPDQRPQPVTVQDTVTDEPLVQVSYVSVVRLSQSCNSPLTTNRHFS